MALTPDQQQLHEKMRQAKERLERQHLGRNGVVGVGVGFKEKNGQQTDQLAVRFYVRKKQQVSADAAVPAQVEIHPTDVIEADIKPHSLPDTTNYDTLVGGISIGVRRGTAGTLGIMVTDNKTGATMMLSNFHVMCWNDGEQEVGDDICQESKDDTLSGCWCSNCATLTRWQLDNVTIGKLSYGIDAAVATQTARKSTVGFIKEIGQAQGTGVAALKMKVQKRGRTSGLTSGVVTDIAASWGSTFNGPTLNNQVVVTGDSGLFTQPGDSGSVYVETATSLVVGLHWGGGSGISAGNPIAAVLQTLDITIPTPKATL